jgi:hypothetical protein
MDANRFASFVRSLATTPSRRHALGVLTGSALGSLLGLLGLAQLPTEARQGKGKGHGKRKRKRKKPRQCVDTSQITICHQGQTLSVSNCLLSPYLARGATQGDCCATLPDLTDCGYGRKCSGGVCAIVPCCGGNTGVCRLDVQCCSGTCLGLMNCKISDPGRPCHVDTDCTSNNCVGFICQTA